MKLTMHIVDAFTDTVFKGNPAAVIVLEEWLSETIMQAIASENNLSETAFIVPREGVFHIRWFSPFTEIDFCGHATLASSFVLFRQQEVPQPITFFAKAVGELTVTQQSDGYIQMRFPNRKPKLIEEPANDLYEGLSIRPAEVWLSQQAYFAVYNSESDVLAVEQDKAYLARLAPYDVVVTAAAEASSKHDFTSRYFWPAHGGDEDPVTGSIHAGLAPLWAEKLQRDSLLAYQASQRGGLLLCDVSKDNVMISGQAVPYLEGVIEVPEH